ncbi:MAG: ankyrin repeat domain-containing protein [Cyanobacteria bacterium J06639_1]
MGHRESTALGARCHFLKLRLDVRYSKPFTGETPLHDAVGSGRHDAARALLEAGADVNAVKSFSDEDAAPLSMETKHAMTEGLAF